MSEQKPLTPQQQRAAQLLGEGRTQEEVAQEVGVSKTSIGQRWLKRDDFNALVKQARDRVLEDNPTAQSTLEQALNATSKSGQPIWPIRVKAAQLLMLGANADPDGDGSGGVRQERIYVSPED